MLDLQTQLLQSQRCNSFEEKKNYPMFVRTYAASKPCHLASIICLAWIPWK